jgi:hypothetical protein
MEEVCRIIDTEFSIADADYLCFTLHNGILRISFVDWQERLVNVVFDDVMAVKWQEAEILREGEPFDGTCHIENSRWLREHIQQCGVNADHAYKHFKFNFNACGLLEVLCTGFHQVTS